MRARSFRRSERPLHREFEDEGDRLLLADLGQSAAYYLTRSLAFTVANSSDVSRARVTTFRASICRGGRACGCRLLPPLGRNGFGAIGPRSTGDDPPGHAGHFMTSYAFALSSIPAPLSAWILSMTIGARPRVVLTQ